MMALVAAGIVFCLEAYRCRYVRVAAVLREYGGTDKPYDHHARPCGTVRGRS